MSIGGGTTGVASSITSAHDGVRYVACNCTGACRPVEQGGKGRCSSMPFRSVEDRIADLEKAIEALRRQGSTVYGGTWKDAQMSGCPCRPENGGSGVCGCVLGGMTWSV